MHPDVAKKGEGMWWTLCMFLSRACDDSHLDTGVAGMEDMIALAAEQQLFSSLGFFAFHIKWFSDEKDSGKKNGPGKWFKEITLERYDEVWMGTLSVLIGYSL